MLLPIALQNLSRRLVAQGGSTTADATGFHSPDNDPSCEVRQLKLSPGIYFLRTWVVGPRSRGLAKIYLDHGDGYSEQFAYGLVTKRERPVIRVIRVERPALAVRFDPGEALGNYQVRELRLVRIPQSLAGILMVRRLRYWRKRHGMAGPHGQTTEQESPSKLWSDYEETFRIVQPRGDYRAWLTKVERTLGATPQQSGCDSKVRFSILLPTYNTEADHLRACLDSVLVQSYPKWELCIADDASDEPRVRTILEEYAAHDSRIRVVHREENGHICEATNSALQLASGGYCVLLDHDDLLHPDALLRVAQEIENNPAARLLYSDEDKLSTAGERCEPHFKPQFNPELLLAQNYVAHLLVTRTEDLLEIGGIRKGFEGSQDHDLVLRLTERLKPEQIRHVPHVLYHWRQSAASTAMAPSAKDYTAEAGKRAVQEALERRGLACTVERAPLLPNGYRMKWSPPERQPLVSLLIPTRDALSFVRLCIESIIENTTYPNFEMVVIDNGSVETETLEYFRQIREDKRIRVVRDDRPFNFSALNNRGAREARGEVLGLVNNDIEVTDGGWLSEMVSYALCPEVGCVGAKLLYPDGTIQHAGVVLGIGGVAGHSHKRMPNGDTGYFGRPHLTHAVSAVTAACLVVRKEVYDQVGGLDEQLAVAFNDVDFCLKVREAGYRNIYTPYAELIHRESATRGSDFSPEKAARFKKEVELMRDRWCPLLDNDPYYSPHLTRTHEDFSVRLDYSPLDS